MVVEDDSSTVLDTCKGNSSPLVIKSLVVDCLVLVDQFFYVDFNFVRGHCN